MLRKLHPGCGMALTGKVVRQEPQIIVLNLASYYSRGTLAVGWRGTKVHHVIFQIPKIRCSELSRSTVPRIPRFSDVHVLISNMPGTDNEHIIWYQSLQENTSLQCDTERDPRRTQEPYFYRSSEPVQMSQGSVP